MYDTILVPTDGSEHAVRAAEHAVVLADVFDATVHVITVIDVQAAAGPFSAGGVRDEFVSELETAGRDAIDTIVDRVANQEELETAVIRGKPDGAILEYADENAVDLVVMGTHGRTGVDRFVAGSVCEEVVRQAPMPVLTARATDDSHPAVAYEDVLIPTDGSTAATAAVEHGIAIAEAVGARVHAVSIVDLGDVAASSEYTVPTDLIETLEARGQRAVDDVAAAAEDAGLDAVTAVRSGYPARDLLEYAADNDVDLIAMGTAGRTGFTRFLLGSTTERVIRHAPAPVLSVNARDRSAE